MTEAIILGQILGIICGCGIVILSVWLFYSFLKYRKLYRKALTGRDLVIKHVTKID